MMFDKTTFQDPNTMNGIGTLYYNNMLDALQGKDQALCDGQQGLLSLEL